MTVIIVDGPEKSGKTTFISALVGALKSNSTYFVGIRKWTGRAVPNDSEYLNPLIEDIKLIDTITIWDRSWVSEYVYGTLLGQDRRLSNDPWLGEWLYGRALQTQGFRIMMEADLAELVSRRDSTDLPVNPWKEAGLFRNYADDFGWMRLSTEYSEKVLIEKAAEIALKILNKSISTIPPQNYTGPDNPVTVFIGSKRRKGEQPGKWLPFTDKFSTEFARILGTNAMKFGWTYAHEIPPQFIRNAKCLVTFGANATLWARMYILTPDSKAKLIQAPDPSRTYSRMGSAKEKRVLLSAADIALSSISNVTNVI